MRPAGGPEADPASISHGRGSRLNNSFGFGKVVMR